jgi:hypothetical protein
MSRQHLGESAFGLSLYTRLHNMVIDGIVNTDQKQLKLQGPP